MHNWPQVFVTNYFNCSEVVCVSELLSWLFDPLFSNGCMWGGDLLYILNELIAVVEWCVEISRLEKFYLAHLGGEKVKKQNELWWINGGGEKYDKYLI